MNEVLTTVITDFLAYKRALGRKYLTEEAALRLLMRFADQQGVVHLHQLSPNLLDEFIASRNRQRARSFNHLVSVLGTFFDWAITQQRLNESPLHTKKRRDTSQRIPFLFGPTEVRQLLESAAALPDNPKARGRGPTYYTVFALCYGLGLRAGEVCGLLIGDVDIERQLLVVRGGKFGKSRLVPHGPRIADLLTDQLQRREAQGASTSQAPLFSFDGQRSIHPRSASSTFRRLIVELEFLVPDGVRPPHLHCLRHSFAVSCLQRWYQDGLDPSSRLMRLATFMGHVDPASTAVYLTITPQLLTEANRRFEAFAEPAWSEDKS